MSDSSDEDFMSDWIPYSERQDWADVTPLEQDDGDHPVVSIAYSPKFKEVYDYFRAIIASGEKSPRALELTKDALALNPANYTVWQYRRDILQALNSNLYDELYFVGELILENGKNYQVWRHRRVIVEWLNDPSKELEFTEISLKQDSKNYHAWQHRQWVIKTYDLYDDELVYVDRLLSEDLWNNSAWNQRFFVLKHYGFTVEVVEREMHYAMNRIRRIKNNESVWNFLRGVLKQSGNNLSDHLEVVEFCEELYENGIRNPFLLSFLIDIYEEMCFKENENYENRQNYVEKIYELCDQLSTTHDKIRRKYWNYIADKIKIKFESINSNNTNNENHTNDHNESS